MQEPETPLLGSTALVTGASRGIGYAIAAALADRGASVTITARKPEALAEAVERLGPDRSMGVAGAADDPAHREEAVARTI